MDEYNMTFEEAQDYISKRGFDIPWNDCDVWVDKDRLTETVANVLKWADNNPADRWISVEDELPPKESEYEDNSIVVLATDGNNVYKGLYRSGEYLSGWFTCDLWELDDITHWMPLPQPPKKGGEQ